MTDAGGRIESVSVSVLTDPDLFNYTGPFIINSPVEWDQEDYKIDHDIIIGNGGSLVIKNNSNVEFDYLAGFIVQGGGELIIQDNTSLSGIAACGYNDWNGIQVHDLGYCEVSTLSMRDCISNVHEDGTLRVTENGILTLQANSTLNVESFGYLCVDETATLNLVAQNSVVNMETDYIMGVNPDLNITPTPNCADICSINQIGEGYINIDENYDFHYEVTIGSDQTWTNENYRFKYNLTIESGATLNLLNSSVHFANNGKIIIEKGGKLIADNSTFDRIDMCFFEMWQGIEVHGDRSWHQFPDANGNYYQGYLEINNSTIKNAKIAVNLWNPEAPQPYQTTGGGHIDVNLYKGIQDTWNQRQTLNHVAVNIPVNQAIASSAEADETDNQAINQYFLNPDSDKRIGIFGHNHDAKIISSENYKGEKSIYANSGTWIDNNNVAATKMNFVVITPQNADASSQTTVKLYNYENGVVTKMAEDSLRY